MLFSYCILKSKVTLFSEGLHPLHPFFKLDHPFKTIWLNMLWYLMYVYEYDACASFLVEYIINQGTCEHAMTSVWSILTDCLMSEWIFIDVYLSISVFAALYHSKICIVCWLKFIDYKPSIRTVVSYILNNVNRPPSNMPA